MQRFLTTLLFAACLTSAAAAVDSSASKNLGDVLLQNSPATHFIWTDRMWYTPGESQTLRWTYDPQGDPYPTTLFVYRENIRTGERMYVSGGQLTATPTDVFGFSGTFFLPAVLPASRAQVVLTAPAPTEVGNYHFVAELRDVTSTQVVKRAWAKFNVADDEVFLGEGGVDTNMSSNTTWKADTIYHVSHQVFVNDGAVLTIEPGTLVLARGQNAVIVVERGGKIMAAGRRELPIVMTCDDDIGYRVSGCWAGLILLGRATENFEGDALAEGVIPATRPVYGGDDDDDSSGVLRYVRVEFAGVDFSNEVQPNAFGFHGVGRGTEICYIQAHEGEDDGIEFFGGTANVKYVVSDGSKDDSLDSTFGWRGNVQYGFILQDNVEGDRGYEGDNNEYGFLNTPVTDPHFWNVTFVGNPVGNRGILTRRGHKGMFANSIVMNFPNDGYEAADADSHAMFHGTLFWNNAGATDLAGQIDDAGEGDVLGDSTNEAADPRLRNYRFEGNPDPRPRDGSPAMSVGKALTPPSISSGAGCGGEAAVDPRGTFRGAFDTNTNWLEEWTFFGSELDYDDDPSNDTYVPF